MRSAVDLVGASRAKSSKASEEPTRTILEAEIVATGGGGAPPVRARPAGCGLKRACYAGSSRPRRSRAPRQFAPPPRERHPQSRRHLRRGGDGADRRPSDPRERAAERARPHSPRGRPARAMRANGGGACAWRRRSAGVSSSGEEEDGCRARSERRCDGGRGTSRRTDGLMRTAVVISLSIMRVIYLSACGAKSWRQKGKVLATTPPPLMSARRPRRSRL